MYINLFNGDAGASGIWVSLFGACLGALGTTFIVIPIVTRLIKKNREEESVYGLPGHFNYWLHNALFLIHPRKTLDVYHSPPILSLLVLEACSRVMMSMTADVIDVDELNTGKRREGTFGAIYWWMVKVGYAIAGALSGLIIWLSWF